MTFFNPVRRLKKNGLIPSEMRGEGDGKKQVKSGRPDGYAWFTMSREVEVKNIQMTATTPEDVQVSLGMIGTSPTVAETSSTGKSLATSTGVLVANGSTASDGQVKAPQNAWDWSNTADISAYYAIGKLIPASSVDGTNIYFTPDANGVGKTVRDDAAYYQANGSTVNDPSGSAAPSGTGYLKATLHAKTTESDSWSSMSGTSTSGTGGYTKSVAWNNTNDDGYYVDIPIWLRTSSTQDVNITVQAYVIPKTASQKGNEASEALYKAVRVALLDTTQETGAASITPTTLIPVADGLTGMASGTSGTLSATPFAGNSILDWYSGTNNSGAVASVTGTSGTYGAASEYTNYNTVVTLAKGSGGQYGAATKIIVRVWLEGNDPDCWNDTAGQDWSINLKFNNGTPTSNDDIAG